jgi:aryl-alcohol dehydrogenase-like predicted oxidoreductase
MLGSIEVSRTIQGYWQLAGGHGSYTESEAIENMRAHFSAGITTLDTADIYGPSELIVGKFVHSQPKVKTCCALLCLLYE